MADNTGPPTRTCVHAQKGQALLDIASADRRVTPADIDGTADFVDDLLRKLRMGRSRRNRYGDLRRRLRLLRAMCRAADRFWRMLPKSGDVQRSRHPLFLDEISRPTFTTFTPTRVSHECGPEGPPIIERFLRRDP